MPASPPRRRRRAVSTPRALRVLVGCPACFRQFEAGSLAAGERLRCLCGELLAVPRPRADEAAVVRCSACGAPREPGARTCEFCHAPFAAGDTERNTICPSCCARIPDRARFCPACATRIDPSGPAPVLTQRTCPTCGEGSALLSRAWPGTPGSFLECRRCGGLWLGRALFELLERRAHTEATALPPPPAAPAAPAPPVVYRPCPECGKHMNRTNYGARSGVVLDLCARDGLWFDAGELEQLLDWIRAGGAARARRLEEERLAELERAQRVRKLEGPAGGGWPADPPEPRPFWLDLAELLFDLFVYRARP